MKKYLLAAAALTLLSGSAMAQTILTANIEPATTWVRAEEYHQDYLKKHPGGYNDHYQRSFDF